MHAVLSIMGALVKKATRAGTFLDVSAAEGILSLMALSSISMATGEEAGHGRSC